MGKYENNNFHCYVEVKFVEVKFKANDLSNKIKSKVNKHSTAKSVE